MAYGTVPAQHLRAWLDSALAAHHAGELDRALSAYRQILAADPEHGPALNLLGTALLQLGRAAEALPHLEHAVRRQRQDARVLANLAQAYLALGRFGDAASAFRKASRIDPRVAQFQVGAASALALDGKLDEAETLLVRLTTRFPDAPLVWFNLGNVYRDTARVDQAIDAYARATELEAARHALAALYFQRGRYADAERVCRESVRLAPADPHAHLQLGNALAQQRRLLEALPLYERAARLAPDDGVVAQTYGGGLVQIGRVAEGLRWLARAAALGAPSDALHRVVSGALLGEGALQEAWRFYAARSGAAGLREQHRTWKPGEPLPQTLVSTRVCVLPEQGLGDELFFLRYAARLASSGAHVAVCCSPKLVPLLQRVRDFKRVVGNIDELPSAELRVLCGDLPLATAHLPHSDLPGGSSAAAAMLADRAYRIRLFWPPPAPSLQIEPLAARVDTLRARLAALGPGPYIGVTWRGGVAPDERQSYAVLYKDVELERLAETLRPVQGTLVAIQRHPAAGELTAFERAAGRPIHDWTHLNEDLEDMLALLSLLNDYVGVSNTNMHLRAAVGQHARVLVPAPPEWRWMRRGRESPWFPRFTTYRQSLQGRWDDALAALQNDLMNSASGAGLQEALIVAP